MQQPVQISIELHAAIQAQLDGLAEQGRAVRSYHVEDHGAGLIVVVCAHRFHSRQSGDSAYTVLVFTTRPLSAEIPVRLLDRYPANEYPQ